MSLFWGTRVIILVLAWILGESLIGKGQVNPNPIEKQNKEIDTEIENLRQEIKEKELQVFNAESQAKITAFSTEENNSKSTEEVEKNEQVIKNLKIKLQSLIDKRQAMNAQVPVESKPSN